MNDEKVIHDATTIDEFELEAQLLVGDEPKVFHDIIVALEKEKLAAKYSNAGEGCVVEHHEVSFKVLPVSQSEHTSSIDPPVVPRYEPDKPHLSLILKHGLEGTSSQHGSQDEEVILDTSSIHPNVGALSEVVTNIFSYLYSVLDSTSINPPATQEMHHE